ncbi:RES domain-containing protein [Soonwooa buanensis]|uniref:RES domain-containing protein n=1 Tax=Soonwooa buanensis TaxID=619805 RepID=A0A1T5ED49_9FLAO|nr:RES domain-containing protein [Soonwooa buanensis]SKB81972.1 RES domain-containing protein [Soonwooa buanensis]
MTLEEVSNHNFLILPKTIPNNQNFREFLNNQLEEYLNLIKDIHPHEVAIVGMKNKINFRTIYSIQKQFVNGIKETIDLYFDGQPANSYQKFDEILSERIKKYGKFLNEQEINAEENYYRIRIKSENYPLKPFEMFHIPFEYRGKVTTQRYSIPGFPSLYLANNLYLAWEELNRPNLENFQAIRLQNKKKFKVLDLTSSNVQEGKIDNFFYKYLMTWPLIIACSLRVADYSNIFKPEYIMPQILLQWIRNSKSLDGILYSSTHLDNKKIIQENKIFNLVLPVKENKDKGFCSHLTSLFESTETISKQLMDLSSGGIGIIFNPQADQLINEKLPSLEIIKGQSNPYNFSILGKMEAKLNGMKTNKIQVY